MSRDLETLAAIEAVYRERGADYFRFALARTSDPDLARDAVQEGFARAIRARQRFRGSGSLEAAITYLDDCFSAITDGEPGQSYATRRSAVTYPAGTSSTTTAASHDGDLVENVHSSSGVRGVGPADRTGKPRS